MNAKSWRFGIAVLVGISIDLSASIFMPLSCWSLVVGLFVAACLAKVSSPREGAILGAIVLLPVGIFAIVQRATVPIGPEGRADMIPLMLSLCFLAVLISGFGALAGLVIGKLFQVTKEQVLIF